MLYPYRLEPTLHVKVWGGRRLADHLHKTLPTDEPYGEAWELHDSAIIANGALAGKTLGEAIAQGGADIIGTINPPEEGLPLLAKLIDAEDWLSVQVHPNDSQAAALEGLPRGKTEAWVVIATGNGGELVAGLRPGTTQEIIRSAIASGSLGLHLVKVRVESGDVLFMPAGTVHAIGPGILLYEIQQSSDTTYRLYDWGRKGLDGKPRPLHIDKAIQVSDTTSVPRVNHYRRGTDTLIVNSPFFKTYRHQLHPAGVALNTEGEFHALTCIKGAGAVHHAAENVDFSIGQTVFLPASAGAYRLSGEGVVLRSWQGRFI